MMKGNFVDAVASAIDLLAAAATVGAGDRTNHAGITRAVQQVGAGRVNCLSETLKEDVPGFLLSAEDLTSEVSLKGSGIAKLKS